MTSSSTSPSRLSSAQVIQNFRLLWLDRNIDEVNDNDCRNCIVKLRQVVNTVNTFTDVDECIDLTTDIQDEGIFIIVSGSFIRVTVPILQNIPQINCVYIMCENKTQHEQWALQWSKVKGVFTDITLICEAVKQAAQYCDQNMVSISFVQSSDETSIPNLDQLDKSFMYTQILKEILVSIDFEQKHIEGFLTYYRELVVGNTIELQNVDKLAKEYHHHQPIWWYTNNYFLYSVLNRALRTMEVDTIIKMGFFVRDLHQHIATIHFEQYGERHQSDSFTVYRGQGLSKTDFDELMKTKGGLMSFNNLLSTSLDRAVSLAFAESNDSNPDLIGILFEITVNPTIPSTPFANIRDVSYYQTEEEIPFSMHSVFRIKKVEQIDQNNRLWQVDLTLTSDNDPQLHALTSHLSKAIEEGVGWSRLGHLMLKIGHFNKAEELYKSVLIQTTNESKKAMLYNNLGLVKVDQGNYTEAIEFYEKAVKINQKILSPTDPLLATDCTNIGGVYFVMGQYSKALSYFEKAFEIFQTTPSNHLNLAALCSNIGGLHFKMSQYSKALLYYEKALEMRQKSLPSNHSDLAISYHNIGDLYSKIGPCSKALLYYEKGHEIFQKTLPSNHPELASSYISVGSAYVTMCESSKGLSYFEKAVEIYQKTLPSNHPHLATAYNNIGLIHSGMGQYSKALSYSEKAHEIFQKTLPSNHPDLATFYNNIGAMHLKMNEYSKALSYFEKAHEIYQKTLPSNHLDLAISYHHIGIVHANMGQYSKALSFYQHAVDIGKRSLAPNHPNLQLFKHNLESLKKKL